jgi:hypothetical protein
MGLIWRAEHNAQERTNRDNDGLSNTFRFHPMFPK